MAKLTDKEKHILNGKNLVFLATINEDGSPQVSPVWAEVRGDIIWINTRTGRVKAKNMARDPRVALSACDAADPYDEIILRGTVIEISGEGAGEHLENLSQKYLGTHYPWHYDSSHRVIVKIQKN